MALDNGDIIRFSIESIHGTGVLAVNTVHYRLEGDSSFIGNEPTLSAAASKFWTHINSAYRQCLVTAYTIDQVRGRTEVETWNGEVADVGSHAVGLTGTLAPGDNKMPIPLAGVIDLRSGTGSRSGRGWIMVPGPRDSSAMDTAGKYAAGGSYDGALNVLAPLLIDKIQETVLAVNAWHLTPVIYSVTRRKRGQSPFYFPVESYLVRKDARYLRRRRTAP